MNCEYCTDEAIGYDEDGNATCGTCTPSERPLPLIIEVSGDDEEDEPDDGTDYDSDGHVFAIEDRNY
jgi:hypothetical protein